MYKGRKVYLRSKYKFNKKQMSSYRNVYLHKILKLNTNAKIRKRQKLFNIANDRTSNLFGVIETKYRDRLNYNPKQGKITYDKGFKFNERRNEIKAGIWYHSNIGGNIHHLKELTIYNQSNPDALTDNGYIEFKNTITANGIDSGTRKGLKQISKNPYGIINDITKSKISDNKAKLIVKKRIKRSQASHKTFVMLKRGNEIISVLRNKK